MNKAIVGEDTKDVFGLIAKDIKDGQGSGYNQMFKQLWWVFDDDTKDGGKLGLSEIQLFFSSHEVKKELANNTSKLKKALRILNNENLSTAEKTLRVKDLNLKKKDGKTNVAPPLADVFEELQAAQTVSIDNSDTINDYYYLEQILHMAIMLVLSGILQKYFLKRMTII